MHPSHWPLCSGRPDDGSIAPVGAHPGLVFARSRNGRLCLSESLVPSRYLLFVSPPRPFRRPSRSRRPRPPPPRPTAPAFESSSSSVRVVVGASSRSIVVVVIIVVVGIVVSSVVIIVASSSIRIVVARGVVCRRGVRACMNAWNARGGRGRGCMCCVCARTHAFLLGVSIRQCMYVLVWEIHTIV